MVRFLRWALVVAGALAALAAVRRILDGQVGTPPDIPVIGGDTWPPVPVNPSRPG